MTEYSYVVDMNEPPSDDAVPATSDSWLDTPRPFESVDEMLELGVSMLLARQPLIKMARRGDVPDAYFKKEKTQAQRWKNFWHRSLQMSGDTVHMANHLLKLRLNRLEREIILVLLIKELSLIRASIRSCSDLLDQIAVTPRERLQAVRALHESSRLARRKLILVDDEDDLWRGNEIYVDPVLVEMTIDPNETPTKGWPVKDEQELYDYMSHLAFHFKYRAEAVREIARGTRSQQLAYKKGRLLQKVLNGLATTLGRHPGWKLSTVYKALAKNKYRGGEPWRIFLVLLCKELGYMEDYKRIGEGKFLLFAGCFNEEGIFRRWTMLQVSSELRAANWIQPCGGNNNHITDTEDDLLETEFELTAKALETVGLTGKNLKRRKTPHKLQRSTTSFSDLVLSAETRQQLEQAMAQAFHLDVMFNKWGLGERLSYGHGITLVFYGPPGTGKTASAHALAYELEKPLVTADYSKIQNCLVGQTEKNIAEVFHEAKERGAVLFWDEADAMFTDRDAARHAWEVRDINVLLQELERFEGICVLATNRLTALDKALERRISLKVKFERPGKQERLEIFRRLIPEAMPLANDVDLAALVEADLSGGEIKNVVLNAARNALARDGAKARVCMQDFEIALYEEKSGIWTRKIQRNIGFNVSKGNGGLVVREACASYAGVA